MRKCLLASLWSVTFTHSLKHTHTHTDIYRHTHRHIQTHESFDMVVVMYLGVGDVVVIWLW